MGNGRSETVREFEWRCQEPDFFRDTERARAVLKPILERAFPGTGACQQFLMEYDIRGVGYSEGDPYPDVSPKEWLVSLGIDTFQSRVGIFEEKWAQGFEQKCLRRFVTLRERHPMLGVGVERFADEAVWRALLAAWEKEFREHYGMNAL